MRVSIKRVLCIRHLGSLVLYISYTSVMSPEILNPESKVGTLNPKTFESGKFCRVKAFLSNPDFFASDISSVR